MTGHMHINDSALYIFGGHSYAANRYHFLFELGTDPRLVHDKIDRSKTRHRKRWRSRLNSSTKWQIS